MEQKKSQVSIEFIIVLGGLLFFLVIFLGIVGDKISYKYKQNQEHELKNIALSVQDEINLAYSTTNGYSRNFSIPAKIGNKNYTAQIIGNLLYLKTEDEKIALSVTIQNVTGYINVGENIIWKENNTVHLNS